MSVRNTSRRLPASEGPRTRSAPPALGRARCARLSALLLCCLPERSVPVMSPAVQAAMLGKSQRTRGTSASLVPGRGGSAWDVRCTQRGQTFCILGKGVAFSHGDAAAAPGDAELFEVGGSTSAPLCHTTRVAGQVPQHKGQLSRGGGAHAAERAPPVQTHE